MKQFLERISRLSPKQLSLLALELQSKVEALEQAKAEPMAIIGLGCRFPGGADNPDAFWQLLRDGQDGVVEVPPDRWDIDALYDPDPDVPGKMSTRWGGFLKDIDKFDPQFFGISPREAASMDPQQRLLLEVCWTALEHAGHSPDRLAGSQTGVFVGISSNDYFYQQLAAGHQEIDAYLASGSAHSVAVGRVSYVLGLHGPSLAIDTACSSSLVAIHQAVQSLRNHECRLALAGGVNVILSPETTITLSKAQMMAADGRCKTFDARADGFVRGEGCGMVVLKRLPEAIADRDNVLAVLRNSGINQDGRSNGLTAPNGRAQEELIREVLSAAGIEPGQIDLVETHGTGTSLGDPIEVLALNAVFGQSRGKDAPLLISSVKTNLGHLESAAGVAGLIKVVLALQHRQIPPHLHVKELNPHIPWADIPVAIPRELTEWPARDGRRLAAVSSFGFGGTNAHVIMEEAPPRQTADQASARPLHVLTLSAKSEEALAALQAQFECHLADNPEPVADVCYTVNTGRAHFDHRLALIAASSAEIRDKLVALAAGQASGDMRRGRPGRKRQPQVAFLFTGQGAQYVGMGQQLYDSQATFRQAMQQCDELLRPYLKQPLLSVLYPDPGTTSPLDKTAYTQPALFALEYALAELWKSWGITPTVVMGHSIGEYAAACVAGIFGLEAGLKLIAERGRLMQQLPGDGAMAAVFADETRVAAALAPWADRVVVAAINGPDNVVVSGEAAAVAAAVNDLAAQGIRASCLNVSHAFHSPLMDPMLDAFEEVAASVPYSPPGTGFISDVTGQLATGADVGHASYWRTHVRRPVQFLKAMATLHEQKCELFVEIGPSPTLLSMGSRCLPEDAGVWLPSLRKGHDDWRQMLESLATLYVNGVSVDWTGFDRDYAHRRLALPTYPFQRERYWFKAATYHCPPEAVAGQDLERVQPETLRRETHDRLDDWLYQVTWLAQPHAEPAAPVQRGSWLVFADDSGVGQGLAHRLEDKGERCVLIAPGDAFQAADGHYRLNPSEPLDFKSLFDQALGPDQPPCRGIVHLWALDTHLSEKTRGPELADGQRRATASVLNLVQAMAASNQSPTAPRLWLVTRGAQSATEGKAGSGWPLAEAAQATIWGLGHVIALEHPELHCVRIDLDPVPEGDSEAQALLAEIWQPVHAEAEVAFRGRARLVRRLIHHDRRTRAHVAGSLTLRADGSYLITGGCGGLGLLVARWMVERGARHLVLMGRRGASPATQQILTGLEQQGAQVTVACGDVSEEDQLAAVLTDIERSGSRLRGIVHAAGFLDDGVLLKQTWDRFTTVLAPKVQGSWHLHRLTRDKPLDFLVMFSSGASLIGSAGQGNHAAANAFMDALAYYRRAQGMPAVSINWGAWSEVGVAARRTLDRQYGAETIAPQEGLQVLEWILAQNLDPSSPTPPQLAVLPNNWSRFLEQFAEHERPALFSEIPQEKQRARTTLPTKPESTRSGSALLDELMAASPNKRLSLLRARIREQAARILGLDLQRAIDPQQPLGELGLDSLMAVQLRSALGNMVGRVLSATLLFEYPTIGALADYLATVLFPADSEAESTAETVPEVTADELDQLSEDEIAALLKQKLEEIL